MLCPCSGRTRPAAHAPVHGRKCSGHIGGCLPLCVRLCHVQPSLGMCTAAGWQPTPGEVRELLVPSRMTPMCAVCCNVGFITVEVHFGRPLAREKCRVGPSGFSDSHAKERACRHRSSVARAWFADGVSQCTLTRASDGCTGATCEWRWCARKQWPGPSGATVYSAAPETQRQRSLSQICVTVMCPGTSPRTI